MTFLPVDVRYKLGQRMVRLYAERPVEMDRSGTGLHHRDVGDVGPPQNARRHQVA